MSRLIECVINISEGRDRETIARIATAAGPLLLDVHSDADHHRSVLTLAGSDPAELQHAARALTTAALAILDLRTHEGVHPRLGVVDVVPFVSLAGPGSVSAAGRSPGSLGRLGPGDIEEAVAQRDAFARWAGVELGLPCFLYGPERSLPEVRRHAWEDVGPDTGPGEPHPTAGAAAVGARPVLVAYNLWLGRGLDLAAARRIAADIRSPQLRTLGLQVGTAVQVSCNLVDPWRVGPSAAFDAVAAAARRQVEARPAGASTGPDGSAGHNLIERAELVGLLPRSVLEAEPARRWAELDLEEATTIEARLEGRA